MKFQKKVVFLFARPCHKDTSELYFILFIYFFYLFIFFLVLMKLLNYGRVSVAFPLSQQAGTLYHLDFFLFHFVKISAKCVILY